MRTKKMWPALVLAVCLCFCVGVFAACNKTPAQPDNPGPVPGAPSITLSATSLTKSVFDDVVLTATVVGTDEEVVWTTSDESIATVTKAGYVVAQKAGTVKITASAGEQLSASCDITFENPSDPLYVSLPWGTVVTLEQTTAQTIGAKVFSGEREVAGATYAYKVTGGDNIVSINDRKGEITAVSNGTVTLEVSASIKGLTATAAIVEVKVVDLVELLFRDGETVDRLDVKTIYLTAGKNKNNPTSFELTPVLKVNGEEQTSATFEFADEGAGSVIDLQVNENKTATVSQKGVRSGSYVKVTYTHTDSRVIEQRIWFEVDKPVTPLEGDLPTDLGIRTQNDFSAIVTASEGAIVPGPQAVLTIDGIPVGYTPDGNKIRFSEAAYTLLSSTTDAEIRIEGEQEIFVFHAALHDFAMSTPDDFKAFLDATAPVGTYSYDVILLNDLDMKDAGVLTRGRSGEDYRTWFYRGTFDGRGHIIENLTMPEPFFYGEFGGTLCNIALINFTLSADAWGFVGTYYNGTMQNVMIQGKMQHANMPLGAGLLANSAFSAATAENVILMAELAGENPDKYSALSYGGDSTFALTNVVVASSTCSREIFGSYNGGAPIEELAGVRVFRSMGEYGLSLQDTGLDKFPSTYFERPEGGKIIVFKNTYEKLLAQYPAEPSEIAFAETCGTELLSGGTLVLSVGAGNDPYTVFTVTESEGVTVDGNKLVAAEDAKTATVTVTATYTHPLTGKQLTATHAVSVKFATLYAYEDGAAQPVYLNRSSALALTLPEAFAGDAVTVTVDGVSTSSATVSGKSFSIPMNTLTKGATTMDISGTVDGELYIVRVTLETWDYGIANAEELGAFFAATNAGVTYDLNVAVTDDFDATGTVDRTVEVNVANWNFTGVFEGNGHIISNLTTMYEFFPGDFNGTLRNIGFYNYKVTGAAFGMIVVYQTHGKMENVMLHGEFTPLGTTGCGVFGNFAGADAVIKNVIALVTAHSQEGWNVPGMYYGINGDGTANGYVIATGTDGTISSNLDAHPQPNAHLYTSVAAYREAVTELGVFPAEYFEISKYGLLLFKGMDELFATSPATPETLTYSGPTELWSGDELHLSIEGQDPYLTWAFEGAAPQGVTLEGNLLKADATAEAGTVLLKATWTHPILGNTVVSDAIAIDVIKAVVSGYAEGEAQQVYLNRGGALELTFEQTLKSDGLDVTLDGAPFSGYSYVEAERKLTISSGLTVAASTLVVKGKDADGIAHVITVNLEVWDFGIGNAEELSAFFTATQNDGVYEQKVSLTADIDASTAGENGVLTRYITDFPNFTFKGVFDGKGHTISNMTVEKELFPGHFDGIFRNVALVNFTMNRDGRFAAFCIYFDTHAVVENVLIQGQMPQATLVANGGMFAFSMENGGVLRNTIGMIEFVGTPSHGALAGYNIGDAFVTDNVVLVTANSKGTLLSDGTMPTRDGVRFYTSSADFKEKETALGEFDETYWSLVNGVPMFTSAQDEIEKLFGAATVTDLFVEEGGTVMTGASVTLHAKHAGTTLALDGEPADVTLTPQDGGWLLSAGDSASGEIKVKATWYHPYYGTESTQTITYTVNAVVYQEKTPSGTITPWANKCDGKLTFSDVGETWSVISATAGGGTHTLSAEMYEIDVAGKTFSIKQLPDGVTSGDVVVAVQSDENYYRYTSTLAEADARWRIDTADDYIGWLKSGDAATIHTAKAVLKADIDLTGKTDAFMSAATYRGELDGEGHTISNWTLEECPMFGLTYYFGSVKNVAFVKLNVTLGLYAGGAWTSTMGAAAEEGDPVSVENVFIDATVTTVSAENSFFGSFSDAKSMKNIVLHVSFEGGHECPIFGIWAHDPNDGHFSNVHVVSSGDNGHFYNNGTGTADDSKLEGKVTKYNDKQAFQAASGSLLDSFNSGNSYWTVDDNWGLIFTTAKDHLGA